MDSNHIHVLRTICLANSASTPADLHSILRRVRDLNPQIVADQQFSGLRPHPAGYNPFAVGYFISHFEHETGFKPV